MDIVLSCLFVPMLACTLIQTVTTTLLFCDRMDLNLYCHKTGVEAAVVSAKECWFPISGTVFVWLMTLTYAWVLWW